MHLRGKRATILYSYDEVWAKPEYPLEHHMEDCLQLFNKVKHFKKEIAGHIAEKANIGTEDLWSSAFFTTLLHDVGKASIPFQKYLRKQGEKESHAFISFYFVNQICSNVSKLKINEKTTGLEALAVASHHSPLHPLKFEEWYQGVEEDPRILKDVVRRYLKNFSAKKAMEYVGRVTELDVSFPQTYNDIYESFALLNARLRTSRTISNDSVRSPFAFLKSILHYCDWYGSSREFSPQYSPDNVESRVLRYLEEKEKKPIKLRKFQEDIKPLTDALLQAPTGTGKTEAATLWADKYTGSKKLLYLLPTMTTCNKMHDRLKKMLGCEVGLLHGTSDYMLATNEEYEGQEEFERIKQSLFCKSFMYPCTVATIDQLLFTMFNWGRWELKLLNAGNSAVIVDEIHAYEPYTVALIVHTLRLLRSLGAKSLVMSATIPTVLRDLLQSKLELTSTYRETSYDNRIRTSIQLATSEEIASAVREIIRHYEGHYEDKKKKVLVICNTVATSKAVYSAIERTKKIKKNELALLHSQFIMRDRAAKEDFLENLKDYAGPYVLVATQVVEVSLDIDFDVLFTEACPIDALIQRLGRVNRRGERSPAEVFIYKQTPNADRVYNPALVQDSVKQLYSRGRSKLKEFELIEIVNDVYDREDYESRLEEELKKTRALIADVQDNLRHMYRLTVDEKMLQQVVTRESDYVTIDVVPRDYADRVLSLPKDERYRRVEFTVKVPYYKIKQNLRQPLDGVLVADVNYDPQLGVIYPERDTEAYIY